MTARLVTIRFSHYCEKARWALDRAGVAYVEHSHAPLLSWLPALRAGGKRTVPSLAPDAGPAVPDSTDILRWCDAHGRASPLFPADQPEVAELEDRFDRRLGPATRRIAYDAILDEPEASRTLLAAGPAWQQALPSLVGVVLGKGIRRGLAINPAGVARSRQALAEELDDVAARLADGRPYLCGDRVTAADLTFAALAAPLTWPAAYAALSSPTSSLGARHAAEVELTRAHPAGAFALRVFEAERATLGPPR